MGNELKKEQESKHLVGTTRQIGQAGAWNGGKEKGDGKRKKTHHFDALWLLGLLGSQHSFSEADGASFILLAHVSPSSPIPSQL